MDEYSEKLQVLYYMENLLIEQKIGFKGSDKEHQTIINSIEFIEGWIQFYQEERKKCKVLEDTKKS